MQTHNFNFIAHKQQMCSSRQEKAAHIFDVDNYYNYELNDETSLNIKEFTIAKAHKNRKVNAGKKTIAFQ